MSVVKLWDETHWAHNTEFHGAGLDALNRIAQMIELHGGELYAHAHPRPGLRPGGSMVAHVPAKSLGVARTLVVTGVDLLSDVEWHELIRILRNLNPVRGVRYHY